MEKAVGRGLNWAGLPVIATVTRLLCRELTLQNEYLRLENRILKDKVSGRIRFSDEERRSLAEAALAMGRSLMKEVVGIASCPETHLAPRTPLQPQSWYSRRLLRLLCWEGAEDGRGCRVEIGLGGAARDRHRGAAAGRNRPSDWINNIGSVRLPTHAAGVACWGERLVMR